MKDRAVIARTTHDDQANSHDPHGEFSAHPVTSNRSCIHANDLTDADRRDDLISLGDNHGNNRDSPLYSSPSGDVKSIELEYTFRVRYSTELIHETSVGDDETRDRHHCTIE